MQLPSITGIYSTRSSRMSQEESRPVQATSESAKDVQDLNKTLLNTVNELTRRHEEWEAALKAKEAFIHTEDERIKKKTMEELAQARAASEAELKAVQTQIAEERGAWEAEYERISHTQQFNPRIKVDVGGVKFTTSKSTLRAVPESMLDAYFSGRHTNETDEEGYHFIDRDGTHFRHILNFLRDPTNFTLELPTEHMKELFVETEYYGLTSSMVAACPALGQCLRQKLLGWLADVKGDTFIRIEPPNSPPQFKYILKCESDSDGRPQSLKILISTASPASRRNNYVGSHRSLSSKSDLGTRIENLRSCYLHQTSDGYEYTKEQLQRMSLNLESVTIDYVNGLPRVTGENVSSWLEHISGVEAWPKDTE